MGRWLNRDLLEEGGGPNLTTFLGNRAVSEIDVLGLAGFQGQVSPLKFTSGAALVGGTATGTIHANYRGAFSADLKISTGFELNVRASELPDVAAFSFGSGGQCPQWRYQVANLSGRVVIDNWSGKVGASVGLLNMLRKIHPQIESYENLAGVITKMDVNVQFESTQSPGLVIIIYDTDGAGAQNMWRTRWQNLHDRWK